MVMTSLKHQMSRIAVVTAAIAAGSLPAGAAFASQGPGGGLGTASGFTQLAMAILVYGSSAAIVAAGLIGAARQRSH
jgi:hypothetical protein